MQIYERSGSLVVRPRAVEFNAAHRLSKSDFYSVISYSIYIPTNLTYDFNVISNA